MPDTAPPADGAALTSSYLQTMLREQVIRTVTSSTRPTGVEGCVIYETDTDRFYYYTGSAWASFGGQATTWTAPTLLNSWVNYGTYQVAQYRKVGDIVHLRGLIKNGTIPATIFTLPSGFRPPTLLLIGTVSYSAIQASVVTVDTSGNVAANAGANGYFALDGVSFSVTA